MKKRTLEAQKLSGKEAPLNEEDAALLDRHIDRVQHQLTSLERKKFNDARATGKMPPKLKGLSLTEILRKRLVDLNSNTSYDLAARNIELIVDALMSRAKAGDMKAIEEILDRIEGKVTEKHELKTESTVNLTFVPADQYLAEQAALPGTVKGIIVTPIIRELSAPTEEPIDS
jgi:hypothetical protein